MKDATKFYLAVAAFVAATAVFTLVRRQPVLPARGTDVSWAPGTRTTYAVKWTSTSTATLESAQQAPLGSELVVEGDLELESHLPAGEAKVIGAHFTKIAMAKGEALTKPLAPGDELTTNLASARAVVTLEPDGRIHDLAFSPETTPVARLAFRAILLDLTAEIGQSGTTVDTSLGRAQRTKAEDGGKVVMRRTQYDELDAFPDGLAGAETKLEASAEITGDEVVSREELWVAPADGPLAEYHTKTTLDAKLRSRVQAAPTAAPAYVPADVRTHRDGHGDRDASLRRRSLGVTRDTLAADVLRASIAPKNVSTEWLWRDAAFLELHPEEAVPLLAASRRLGLNAEAAAFDVVVVSGTEQGQSALIAALERDDEREYMMLIQRLQFVVRPTMETIAFVSREVMRHKGTQRGYAAMYTLGAVASHVASADPKFAVTIMKPVVEELGTTKDPEVEEDLVAALGNAGLPEHKTLLLRYRASPSADVRRAVANSLRKLEGDDVVDALLDLVLDKESPVASIAVTSLMRKQLAQDDWNALEDGIVEGKLTPDNHGALVNALARRNDPGPEVTHLLAVMLESPSVADSIKQQIASILQTRAVP